MLVRNLDFLSIPKEFSKVEIDIYEKQAIALVYIANKGYSLLSFNTNEYPLLAIYTKAIACFS